MGGRQEFAEYVEGEGERLMVLLKSLDNLCNECTENMTMIARDRLAFLVDGTEVIRIREIWKCLNGHTALKLHGEHPKIIIN